MSEPATTSREKFSWAMYDFANSGFTTVVLTTIYNAYFVSVIAMGNGFDAGSATLLWTLAIAAGNALILFTAPVVGALADIYAIRKRLLIASTLGCVFFTAMLSTPDRGEVSLAIIFIIASYYMFATGENLIAAFLPELATSKTIGRLSGLGWSIGFLGGLFTLSLCLGYVTWAESIGHISTQYVPVCMLIVAASFALAAMPTFLWLKERGRYTPGTKLRISNAFNRVFHTLKFLGHLPDLRRFMLALTCFHAGIYIVILLAAVYAEQVMGFDTKQNIILIGIVNITAAAGAFAFGHIQDKLGSVRTLLLTLILWCLAILLVWLSSEQGTFWIAANLIGLALGASQSASRALIGLFSPANHYGEFYGLWGMCVKFAAIIGPISYGFLNWLNQGDHRTSLLVTLVFFVAGFIIMLGINEQRGIKTAQSNH